MRAYADANIARVVVKGLGARRTMHNTVSISQYTVADPRGGDYAIRERFVDI